MLMGLLAIPVGLYVFVSLLYKQSAVMKKEENKIVAEKKVVIKPQLTPCEVDNMHYRLVLARFLVAQYGDNMEQWQPDSWFELNKRPWFICRIFLSNGLTEDVKVWQKDEKPYKIDGVGASFCNKANAIGEQEFKMEKERREFDFQKWLAVNTKTIMNLCMTAKQNGDTSVLLPNAMLPLTLECKKIVQKNLMQTQMLGVGSSEITDKGLYFQIETE